jgi:hypothetical protein
MNPPLYNNYILLKNDKKLSVSNALKTFILSWQRILLNAVCYHEEME